MKNYNIVLVVLAIISQGLLSCAPVLNNGFSSRKFSRHHDFIAVKQAIPSSAAQHENSPEFINPAQPLPLKPAAVELTASLEPVVITNVSVETKTPAYSKAEVRKAVKAARAEMKRVSAVEKPAVNQLAAPNPAGASLLEVILAILLPPLAVFLHSGLSGVFWVDLILTLLFWVPGVIFALLVVFDVI